MTNREIVAAFIAARAPEPRERTGMFDCYFDGSIMKPNVVVNNAHPPVRYRLLPVPGTELCDECPCCGEAHHVQACPAIRVRLFEDEPTTEQVAAIVARMDAEPHRCLGCNSEMTLDTPDPGYCLACCTEMSDPRPLFINPNIARTA